MPTWSFPVRRTLSVVLLGLLLAAPAAAQSSLVELSEADEADLESDVATVLGPASEPLSLRGFWSLEFSALPYLGTYHDPVGETTFYLPGFVPTMGCGTMTPEQAAGNAFYCRVDETIWLDLNLLRQLYRDFGDTAPAAVVAHEFGHHIGKLAGTPTESVRLELQADCYAGIYMADLDASGALEEGDVAELIGALPSFGDQADPDRWFDPGVHGTGLQRLVALGSGFDTFDPRYCLAYNDWDADPAPLVLGDRRWVLPPPGTRSSFMEDGALRLTSPWQITTMYTITGLDPDQPAADQLETAVAALSWSAGAPSISLIADSWMDGVGAASGTAAIASLSSDPWTIVALLVLPAASSAGELWLVEPTEDGADPIETGLDVLRSMGFGYCDLDAPTPSTFCD